MDWLAIFLAKYLVFILPVLLVYVIWRTSNDKRLKLIMLISLSSVIAVVLVKIGEKLYYHPRPFMVSDIKPLIHHSADNGFPSEHAAYAMTLAGVLLVSSKRIGYWALAVAILVGLGRVLVRVHSPIDIIGGFIAGGAAVWLGHQIIKKYFSRILKTYTAISKPK